MRSAPVRTPAAQRRIGSSLTVAFVAVLAGGICRGAELPVLVKEGFEQAAERWQPTDEKAWKLVDGPTGKAYSLFRQSQYRPPHRSPVNFALVKDLEVGDLALEVKVRSTCRDYDHRDVCLVFGYRDPAHFYYVHFGKKTDDHANQIFIVDGKPRTKISTKTSAGTPWTDGWHTVKLTRDAQSGAIEVFFDDLTRPVMTARDTTFRSGRVGLGSFDDTADFDELTLRGASPPAAR